MLNSKKITLAALAVAILLGATPMFAQLAGAWEGIGEGYCYPEPDPDVVIYPWQNWKGEIPVTYDIFTGEWSDSLGNHGTFEGEPVPSIPEIAVFRGYWTWETPKGIFKGGEFKMVFYFMMVKEPYCEGTWTTDWHSPVPGTMKGWKVH